MKKLINASEDVVTDALRGMAAAISTSSDAGPILRRTRPGSPWIPMPSSISSSPSSKVGVPAEGVVHDVSAMPNDLLRSLALRATAATAARSPPDSARAPPTFSTTGVAPVPRRPAVYSESSTATSSFTSTDSTLMPSSPASSAASWKFMTSPV